MDARTLIVVAIIGVIGTIGAALVSALAAVVAAIVSNRAKAAVSEAGKSVVAVERTVAKAEKNIKEISGSLPSWKVLLEHDENGNPIAGNVENLIEAAHNGYPIKVRIKRSEDRFEVMDAQWLFVDQKLVHASNTSQISITQGEAGNYVIPQNPWHYFVVVNNTGYHHAS